MGWFDPRYSKLEKLKAFGNLLARYSRDFRLDLKPGAGQGWAVLGKSAKLLRFTVPG